MLDFCQDLPVRTFQPGETILWENRKEPTIYILKRGAVEVQRHNTEVNRAASPGSVFGEISVLLNIAHTATVVALEPCEFYVAENGEEFLAQNPEIHGVISKLLAHRLYRVTQQLVELKERCEGSGDDGYHVDGVLRTLVDQM